MKYFLALVAAFGLCSVGSVADVRSSAMEQERFQKNFAATLGERPEITRRLRGRGAIGLGLIPRNYNDSEAAWDEALQVAEHLGAEVLQLQSGYWHEESLAPGVHNWEATHRFFKALEKRGRTYEVSQDIAGPFFHERLSAPDYLKPIELTDPKFADAYIQHLHSYLSAFGTNISRLLVHAEGSYNYFAAHPDHLKPYVTLLTRIVASVRSRWPHIRVGVNIDPHRALWPHLAEIAEPLDFVGFDIVQTEGLLENPDQLAGLIDALLARTGGKPISLACVWSSAGIGGGDAVQARFIEAAFKVLGRFGERIEYIAFGPPFAEDEGLVGPAYRAQFDYLPKDFVEAIIAWATQLGLIRLNGTAKPGFATLYHEIQNYYATQ